MATKQTDLDRLHIAWGRLRDFVNRGLPDLRSRLQAARNRIYQARY